MNTPAEIIQRLDRIEQLLAKLVLPSGEHRMDLHLVKTLGPGALDAINKRKKMERKK